MPLDVLMGTRFRDDGLWVAGELTYTCGDARSARASISSETPSSDF